jgi:hypothetical protein
MDSMTEHEIDSAGYLFFKNERKEHIKVDFPTMSDEAIEKKLAGEWENLSPKLKMNFYNLVSNDERFHPKTIASNFKQ